MALSRIDFIKHDSLWTFVSEGSDPSLHVSSGDSYVTFTLEQAKQIAWEVEHYQIALDLEQAHG